jgi:hypothetical protein
MSVDTERQLVLQTITAYIYKKINMMSSHVSSDAERQLVLQKKIADYTAMGWEFKSQSQFSAVFIKRKKVNHILHLILSVVTSGFWLLVWLALVLINMNAIAETKVISIDERGLVQIH